MASYPKLLNHPQTSHIPTASHQGPKSALSLAPSHTFPVAAHQTTPHFAYTPGESHRKHPNSAAASQVRQGPLRPSQACGLVLAAPPPHTHFTTLYHTSFTPVHRSEAALQQRVPQWLKRLSPWTRLHAPSLRHCHRRLPPLLFPADPCNPACSNEVLQFVNKLLKHFLFSRCLHWCFWLTCVTLHVAMKYCNL